MVITNKHSNKTTKFDKIISEPNVFSQRNLDSWSSTVDNAHLLIGRS